MPFLERDRGSDGERMSNHGSSLLKVDDLRVYYGDKKSPIRAVDGVGFSVERGENVGLVGESGCGKSTLGRAIMRLEELRSGKVVFSGEDVSSLKGRAIKEFRSKVQMIFQDPYGSLNPRMSVGNALDEVLLVHHAGRKAERRERAAELFGDVGLDPVYLDRYPHEFSGGQRQRIGIARALAVKPQMIIADEPVSALDVSVQVQILNLLKDLQEKMDLSYIFVAHDLAVVRYVCDRILVMYLGRMVESASADSLYASPAHPYTEALLSAIPDVDKELKLAGGGHERIVLTGDVPSPTKIIPGCPFHPRCPRAREKCAREVPLLREVAPGHTTACHFAEDVLNKVPIRHTPARAI